MIIEAIFASLGCFKGPKSISSKFLRDIWISRTSRLSENYVLISLSACSRATWHWQISCFLYNKMFGLGREPWSSGYSRRLVFKRSWVRNHHRMLDRHNSYLYKNCIKTTENKRLRKRLRMVHHSRLGLSVRKPTKAISIYLSYKADWILFQILGKKWKAYQSFLLRNSDRSPQNKG